jgi:hypothetical protein
MLSVCDRVSCPHKTAFSLWIKERDSKLFKIICYLIIQDNLLLLGLYPGFGKFTLLLTGC